jgi:integrase/recombinase XerD
MKPLREAIEDYIGLRRSLGFKLREPARELRKFASFMEQKGATHVTTALALEWATQLTNALPAAAAKRLSYVRGFARHWSATDSRTEVPPDELLPFQTKRARPYLYSEEEVHRLLTGCNELTPKEGLTRKTYYCLVGLLAVTGLRISEAVNLDRLDVDFAEAVLTVRKTKFGKTRLVPLHASTVAVLADYGKARDKLLPKPSSSRFFLNDYGRHLQTPTVQAKFAELSRRVGLRAPGDRRGPRLHDFRHRFAVNTLIRWYRQEQDVDRLLPVLSTYLGHVRVSDTYWYLSVEPELMGAAMRRLERRWGVQDAE